MMTGHWLCEEAPRMPTPETLVGAPGPGRLCSTYEYRVTFGVIFETLDPKPKPFDSYKGILS